MNTPTRAAAKKKMTEKMDMAMDKKMKVKESSAKDTKLDMKMGMPAMFKKKSKK